MNIYEEFGKITNSLENLNKDMVESSEKMKQTNRELEQVLNHRIFKMFKTNKKN